MNTAPHGKWSGSWTESQLPATHMWFQHLISGTQAREGQKRWLPSSYDPRATGLYRAMLKGRVTAGSGDGGKQLWVLSALDAQHHAHKQACSRVGHHRSCPRDLAQRVLLGYSLQWAQAQPLDRNSLLLTVSALPVYPVCVCLQPQHTLQSPSTLRCSLRIPKTTN